MKHFYIASAILAASISPATCLAAIDAQRIERDISVMAMEAPQPIAFNNQNRSFNDPQNPEYEYRDAPVEDMSRYQYQDDLLNMMFEATKSPSDLLAFEAEILKGIASVKDANTKCELIRLLEISGSKKSADALKPIVLGEDERFALAAVGALQKMPCPEAIGAVKSCLKGVKNKKVKDALERALALRAGLKNKNALKKFAAKPTQTEAFVEVFSARPTKAKALEALKSDNEYICAYAVPYVFAQEPSLIGELQKRFDSASPSLKAWIITKSACVQNEASKKFVLDNALKDGDENVMVASAFAAEKFGGADAAKLMLAMHEKTRGRAQNRIDWALERTVKDIDQIEAYLVSEAKNDNKMAVYMLGKKGFFKAKPLLMQKLDSPVWYHALQAFESLADTSDIAAILEIIKTKKAGDTNFSNRFGFVVRDAAIRSAEPEKLIGMIADAAKTAPEAQRQNLEKCYFLALYERGDCGNLESLAKKVAGGGATKLEVSSLPQFAKRLSSNNWRRMPNHKKFEEDFSKILASAKCDEASKSALEKALFYIQNRGEEKK